MSESNLRKLFPVFQPVPTSEWEARISADLKGADYRKKLIWQTEEGFDVRPYYRSEDLAGLEHVKTLPGHSPYVRGIKKYDNSWIIRQDIHEADVVKANAIALDAISKGVMEIGFNATKVTSQKQMDELLNGIDLERISICFMKSYSYPVTVELFGSVPDRRKVRGDRISGSINFDPISYLLLHGDFYEGWEENTADAKNIISTIREKLPGFRAITINGHYFQDSGAHLVQELAFTLAAANEYLAGLTDKGLSVDAIVPRMMFSFAVGPNYFLEIAKFRACRLLWSQIVSQYSPADEKSLQIHLHARTARWNKSVYDPYVNMLRTTTESMSAILGNADSVTVGPFDAIFREPTVFSERIARNLQLVLKEESYLDKIVDPAAGSYYIENLTHSLAHHAWELFKKVEGLGGMLEAVKSGFIQSEVERSRCGKEASIAQRKIIMLGTNQYPNLQETMAESIGLSPENREEAPATYARLIPFQGGSGFEKIRLVTERYVLKGHKRPRVFLFTMGNLAMLRARAGFASNFFGCAGFEIIDNPGFSETGEGVDAALMAQPDIVVICSSDDEYAVIVPGITQQIKEKLPSALVVVAGYPKDLAETFRNAGVFDFIHVKSNLFETLEKFQRLLIHD